MFRKSFQINFLFLILLVFSLHKGVSQEYYSSQFLVCFNKNVNDIKIDLASRTISTGMDSFDDLFNRFGITGIEPWLTSASEKDIDGDVKLANIYRLRYIGRQAVEDVIQAFRKNEWILSAQKEPVIQKNIVIEPHNPIDPLIQNQWFIYNVWADWAWGLWTTSGLIPGDTSIVIGIVDSGTQWDHSDLMANIWVNPLEDVDGDGIVGDFGSLAEGGDEDGVDNDGNGKIDDLIGWDFVGEKNDSLKEDNNPMSGIDNHGTAVAGCASASTNNGIGVAGVGYRAQLLITKHTGDEGSEFIFGAYDGILYAAKSGADIINCSWGSDGFSSFSQNVINVAHNTYGAMIVAAAGNDGENLNSFNQYPAEYNNVVCVAGIDINDRKVQSSNYGDAIDICAPFSGIYTTDLNNRYQFFSGTSFCSPIVAGGLALLKSMYPDSSLAWLENRISESGDNIDDINPDFAGLLGGGRLNLYKAIGQGLLPKLSIKATSLLINNGDDDERLNPGEEASLRVTLQNEMGWQNATKVDVLLQISSSYITLIDSTYSYGDISGGSFSINLSSPFKFFVDNFAPNGEYNFNLNVLASSDFYDDLEFNLGLPINISTFQKGWPVQDLGFIQSSPLIANTDSLSGLEIFCGNNNGQLLAWNKDGTNINQFPIELSGQIWSSPALGDIDNDADKEIIIGSNSGHLYVVSLEGSIIKDFNIGEPIYGNVSLVDFDQNGDLEIVFGTFSGNVHVLNHDGSDFSNFPVIISSEDRITGGCAVLDLDMDESFEIVAATQGGNIYVLNSNAEVLEGFPFKTTGGIFGSVVAANLDNSSTSVRIIAGDTSGKLYVLKNDGSVDFEYNSNFPIRGTPGVCDVDKNGTIEIFFGNNENKVYGLSSSGNLLAGFPKILAGAVESQPVFADLYGSGNINMIFTALDGKLYVYDFTAQDWAPGFPYLISGSIKSTPTIIDIDVDNDLEIAFGTNNSFVVIDINQKNGSVEQLWSSFQANIRRTGYFGDVLTNVQIDDAIPVVSYDLSQNHPNPFNPVTTIQFSLKNSGMTQLTIFNILGQEVARLVNKELKPGIYSVSWDAKNLPSGIYLYRIISDTYIETKRMILLK